MKTTVTVHIEFEDGDDESCGVYRKVESQCSGGWGSVGEAFSHALTMSNVPRPVQTAALIVQYLAIERNELPSGRMAEAADDIVEAWNHVDQLKKCRDTRFEDLVAAMALI